MSQTVLVTKSNGELQNETPTGRMRWHKRTEVRGETAYLITTLQQEVLVEFETPAMTMKRFHEWRDVPTVDES